MYWLLYLNKRHVHFIHIRSLLSVYFNVDKMLVHDVCNFLIFKRFPLHDMTPVTSGVAHWKKDEFVLVAGLLESFLSPWVPWGKKYFLFTDETLKFYLTQNLAHSIVKLLISEPHGTRPIRGANNPLLKYNIYISKIM